METVLFKRLTDLPEITEFELCLIPFWMNPYVVFLGLYTTILNLREMEKRKGLIIKTRRPEFFNISTIDILDRIVLCVGSCPVHFKMFRGTSGVYLLDARSSLPVVTTTGRHHSLYLGTGPTLQIKKLRLRNVKEFAQGPRANSKSRTRTQNQDLNLRPSS